MSAHHSRRNSQDENEAEQLLHSDLIAARPPSTDTNSNTIRSVRIDFDNNDNNNENDSKRNSLLSASGAGSQRQAPDNESQKSTLTTKMIPRGPSKKERKAEEYINTLQKQEFNQTTRKSLEKISTSDRVFMILDIIIYLVSYLLNIVLCQILFNPDIAERIGIDQIDQRLKGVISNVLVGPGSTTTEQPPIVLDLVTQNSTVQSINSVNVNDQSVNASLSLPLSNITLSRSTRSTKALASSFKNLQNKCKNLKSVEHGFDEDVCFNDTESLAAMIPQVFIYVFLISSYVIQFLSIFKTYSLQQQKFLPNKKRIIALEAVFLLLPGLIFLIAFQFFTNFGFDNWIVTSVSSIFEYKIVWQLCLLPGLALNGYKMSFISTILYNDIEEKLKTIAFPEKTPDQSKASLQSKILINYNEIRLFQAIFQSSILILLKIVYVYAKVAKMKQQSENQNIVIIIGISIFFSFLNLLSAMKLHLRIHKKYGTAFSTSIAGELGTFSLVSLLVSSCLFIIDVGTDVLLMIMYVTTALDLRRQGIQEAAKNILNQKLKSSYQSNNVFSYLNIPPEDDDPWSEKIIYGFKELLHFVENLFLEWTCDNKMIQNLYENDYNEKCGSKPDGFGDGYVGHCSLLGSGFLEKKKMDFQSSKKIGFQKIFSPKNHSPSPH